MTEPCPMPEKKNESTCPVRKLLSGMACYLAPYRDIQLLVLGFCILIGLVLAGWIGSYTVMSMQKYPQQVISVTGAATKDIVSDFAQWDGYFSRQSASLESAYAALEDDRKRVEAMLSKLGVKHDAMTFSQVNTTTKYHQNARGYNSNEISGYELRQTVTVSSDDVELIDRISRESSELISQGVYLSSSQPQYFYTKLDDLKVEMLGLATENAYDRADAMAKATKQNTGQLRSANMGVFQITDKNSTEVSDYGINDTSAKDKKVTAVVNARFELR